MIINDQQYTITIMCKITLFMSIVNMLVLTNNFNLTKGGKSPSLPRSYKSATQSPLLEVLLLVA